MSLDGDEALNDRVHTIWVSWAMLADRTMDETEMLEQQQPSFVVQSVQRFVARIFLQLFRDFPDVILRHRARRCDAFELVEQVGVFQQQLLETKRDKRQSVETWGTM